MWLENLKTELMQDCEFKQEYEKSRPLFEIKRKIIRQRIQKKLTQAQVAEAMQVKQSVISRFESADNDFKFSTLQSYAKAVGLKKLTIEF